MKFPLIMPAALCAAVLTGCSSLDVMEINAPKTGEKPPALNGVPYYPPRQDFVASVLGFDENGKPTSNAVLKIDLVTRPDTEHGYVITNSPGPFSTSEFEINRDAQGRLLSLSAKTEDKTVETVTALASLVVKVAAFAGEPVEQARTLDALQKEFEDAVTEKAALEAEIKTKKAALSKTSGTAPTDDDKKLLEEIQVATEKLRLANEKIKRLPLQQELLVTRAARLQTLRAIEKLAQNVSADGKELKLARENLAALNDRLAALQSGLADSAAAKGVTKSGTRRVVLAPATSQEAAAVLAAKLPAGDIGVYVVPR